MSPCFAGGGFQAITVSSGELGDSAARNAETENRRGGRVSPRLLKRINQTAHVAHSSWEYLDSAIVCGARSLRDV